MPDGKWRMREGGGAVRGGGGWLRSRADRRADVSGMLRSDRGTRFDLVRDDSTSDAMGILSHVGTDAADGACQGEGLEQSLACDVKTLEERTNEPNLESMQSVYSQRVEPEYAELAGRERSQSAAGGQVVHDAGDDRVEPIVSAGKGD